ncbi:MAG: hypothetical protein PGN13_16185 [Patulibacter minatonensis]
MQIPDAVSEIRWPDGWVDGQLVVEPEILTLKLASGKHAAIVTTCTDKGTGLFVLDAPGVQRLARMRVLETPMGCMGAPIEMEHRGRPLTRDEDKPLVEAWDALERSWASARAKVEADWNRP